MQVKTSLSNPVYLRGFVGSVYTGSSWEPLPDSDYQSAGDWDLYQTHPLNFGGKVGDSMQYEQFVVTVRNLKANKKCVYIPYGLGSTPSEFPNVQFGYDSIVLSGACLLYTSRCV